MDVRPRLILPVVYMELFFIRTFDRDMGLIHELSSVLGETETEQPYECRGCHKQFDVEYFTCPHCGSFSVEPRP